MKRTVLDYVLVNGEYGQLRKAPQCTGSDHLLILTDVNIMISPDPWRIIRNKKLV